MTALLRDLISIVEASEKYKLPVKDLLCDALDDKISAVVVSKKDRREAITPSIYDPLPHESFDEWNEKHEALNCITEHISIQLGQILYLTAKAIKSLIVNNEFNEVELYKPLTPIREDLDFDYWMFHREMYSWRENTEPYSTISIDQVQVSKQEIEHILINPRNEKITQISPEGISNTALKVIALFMHHLAKTQKFASGSKPNKSQIKELLLELADELGIDPYGLNKVDERLLADAMKYLENQKR